MKQVTLDKIIKGIISEDRSAQRTAQDRLDWLGNQPDNTTIISKLTNAITDTTWTTSADKGKDLKQLRKQRVQSFKRSMCKQSKDVPRLKTDGVELVWDGKNATFKFDDSAELERIRNEKADERKAKVKSQILEEAGVVQTTEPEVTEWTVEAIVSGLTQLDDLSEKDAKFLITLITGKVDNKASLMKALNFTVVQTTPKRKPAAKRQAQAEATC